MLIVSWERTSSWVGWKRVESEVLVGREEYVQSILNLIKIQFNKKKTLWNEQRTLQVKETFIGLSEIILLLVAIAYNKHSKKCQYCEYCTSHQNLPITLFSQKDSFALFINFLKAFRIYFLFKESRAYNASYSNFIFQNRIFFIFLK